MCPIILIHLAQNLNPHSLPLHRSRCGIRKLAICRAYTITHPPTHPPSSSSPRRSENIPVWNRSFRWLVTYRMCCLEGWVGGCGLLDSTGGFLFRRRLAWVTSSVWSVYPDWTLPAGTDLGLLINQECQLTDNGRSTRANTRPLLPPRPLLAWRTPPKSLIRASTIADQPISSSQFILV